MMVIVSFVSLISKMQLKDTCPSDKRIQSYYFYKSVLQNTFTVFVQTSQASVEGVQVAVANP